MVSGSTVIWWIRRDLRLIDNPALSSAKSKSGTVIPLFILDNNVLNSRYNSKSKNRLSFLFGGLKSLDSQLKKIGSRLIIRRGKPLEVIRELVSETGFKAGRSKCQRKPPAGDEIRPAVGDYCQGSRKKSIKRVQGWRWILMRQRVNAGSGQHAGGEYSSEQAKRFLISDLESHGDATSKGARRS